MIVPVAPESTPPSGNDPATVPPMVRRPQVPVMVSEAMVGCTLFTPFVCAMSVQMKRVEGRYSPLAYVQLLCGLINFVLGAMFLVLPAFWVAALAWAGIHAGGIFQALVMGTAGARAAGSTGSDTLIKAVK